MALEDFNMSMRVTAITRKRSAVFASIVSQVTPSESSVLKRVAYEPLFLTHLRDALRVQGILSVTMHEPLTNIRPVIFLRFENETPREEVWRGLEGASTLQAQCGKIVIALSSDIDPLNTDAIFWSLAYRMNPADDLRIVTGRQRGPRAQGQPGRGVRDARRRDTQDQDDAPGAAGAAVHGQRTRYLGGTRLARACHRARPGTVTRWAIGSDAWERFARNAVEGRWGGQRPRAPGQRRRGGMVPETPARLIEDDA